MTSRPPLAKALLIMTGTENVCAESGYRLRVDEPKRGEAREADLQVKGVGSDGRDRLAFGG